MSLYYARIKLKTTSQASHSQSQDNAFKRLGPENDFHYFSGLEKDSMFSQDELRIIYESIYSLKEEDRYRIEPQAQPGLQIRTTISQAVTHFRGPCGLSSCFAMEAFPDILELLEQVLTAFENGSVVIDCISLKAISAPNIKAISRFSNGCIHLIVGCELNQGAQQQSIETFCHRYVHIFVFLTVIKIVSLGPKISS